MRLYLAAVYTNDVLNKDSRVYASELNDFEREQLTRIRYILESYHYVKSPRKLEVLKKHGARVFMDSGAFSAFTLGEEIDIQAYCSFLRENPEVVEMASVLDGIGDPLKTYQNQCHMEYLGQAPLPCFHFGEDERYLEHYVQNYPYITLGGMVPHSSQENKLWLDRIWSRYLTNKDGSPKLKVHGFGMTSLPLMKRYPWYSVDSSSWLQIGNVGNVYIPRWGIVSLSEKSPSRKVAGQHIETVQPPARKAIIEEIESLGFEYDRLKRVYASRWVFNIMAYCQLNLDLETKDLRYTEDQIPLF